MVFELDFQEILETAAAKGIITESEFVHIIAINIMRGMMSDLDARWCANVEQHVGFCLQTYLKINTAFREETMRVMNELRTFGTVLSPVKL